MIETVLLNLGLFLAFWFLSNKISNECKRERNFFKNRKAPKMLRFIMRPKDKKKTFVGILLFYTVVIPAFLIFILSIVLAFWNPPLLAKITLVWVYFPMMLLLAIEIIFEVTDIIIGAYRKKKRLNEVTTETENEE